MATAQSQEWLDATILTEGSKALLLWCIARGLINNAPDLSMHFTNPDFLAGQLDELQQAGVVTLRDNQLALTDAGHKLISYLQSFADDKPITRSRRREYLLPALDYSLAPPAIRPATLQPDFSSINRQAVANIQEIFANEQLPRKIRRDLIRQEFTSLIEKRDVQLEAALRVEKRRVAGTERVANEQKRRQEEFLLQIRQEMLDVLATLGVAVRTNSLDCILEFSKKIDDFKRDVQREDIEPVLKELLLQKAKDAFYSLAKELAEIAGSEAEKVMRGA